VGLLGDGVVAVAVGVEGFCVKSTHAELLNDCGDFCVLLLDTIADGVRCRCIAC
jgi:hypothetical protein